ACASVQLGECDTRDTGRVAEEPRLLQAVLSRGRVDDEQRLVRRALDSPRDHPPYPLELGHEIGLRVEPPGGVDDRDVRTAGPRRLDGVEGDCCRVGTPRRTDEVGTRALRPDLELLLRSRPKRVRGADENRASVLGELSRELSDR